MKNRSGSEGQKLITRFLRGDTKARTQASSHCHSNTYKEPADATPVKLPADTCMQECVENRPTLAHVSPKHSLLPHLIDGELGQSQEVDQKVPGCSREDSVKPKQCSSFGTRKLSKCPREQQNSLWGCSGMCGLDGGQRNC